MADELEINKGGVVSLIDNHELGEILKPLVREIYLFNSYVAGTTHLEDQSVLGEIKEEDDLLLQREDNRFDQNAILVLTNERRKLGYIPKKDNVVFARLMDAGKLLKAKITTIEHRGDFTEIGIGDLFGGFLKKYEMIFKDRGEKDQQMERISIFMGRCVEQN